MTKTGAALSLGESRRAFCSPSLMSTSRLAARLLAWYRQNGRILPWRGHPDPYAVWVSEIMLQQTRVETVIPYFERWLARFPTVAALAQASEQEVLQAWEGLGYYSRARHLHAASRMVMEKFGGQLPADPESLHSLPGVGPYTAGAIASIAFGLDVPALDGNIRRVYARLFDVAEPVTSPAGERLLWQLAAEHLPAGQAGDFNQALMDLGAMICLPKKPLCGLCPLADLCRARQAGTQEQRPVRLPKAVVPHQQRAAGVILVAGRVLLVRRPARGLLGGMWEFPNGAVEDDPASGVAAALETGYRLRVRAGEPLGVIHHAYTHLRVSVYAFCCELLSIPDDERLNWAAVQDLPLYPMGKVDRLIAQKVTTSA